jgi:peptide/nickel transport system substrate-binding protein
MIFPDVTATSRNPMREKRFMHRFVGRRSGLQLYFLIAGLLLGPPLLGAWAAQPPTRKPPVEQEDPDAAKKPKKHLRLDDESAPPASAGGEAPRLAVLVQEAEQSGQSALRKLFQDLSIPYDVVTWKGQPESKVEPVAPYVAASDRRGAVNLRRFNDSWQRGPLHHVPLAEIERIDHFEDIALRRVNEFLQSGLDRARPGSEGPSLTRVQVLQATSKVLSAVAAWHRAARESGQRDGAAWDEVEQRLRLKLRQVQFDELQDLVQAQDWPAADALAVRLARVHSDAESQRTLVGLLVRLVKQPFDAGNLPEARNRLDRLQREFPDGAPLRPIADALRNRAQALLDQAREKWDKQHDRGGAMELLTQAESVDPELPGLQDFRLQVSGDYPTLGVGVHELPERFSPASAVTDSERQTVELLFEGLVKPYDDTDADQQVYEPGLAERLPDVIPLGRRFRLARDAYWSNGNRVTAADVGATAKLLHGSAPAWADLVREWSPGSDPFQVDLKLTQGFLDPLSLMTFKILPASASLGAVDDPAFARNPVGSGPYRLATERSSPDAVVFVANPHFRRAGRPVPAIREIRFFHSTDPARDFQAGRLHVLLDLPTARLQQIKSVPNVTARGPVKNRRIYFLAVNHRRLPELQNREFRKAIAHAIDRKKILDDVFRSYLRDEADPPHRPLNGPFPPDCWASKPGLRPLFSAYLAKGYAGKAQQAGAGAVELGLKYPANDEEVQRACEMIRDQVRELVGVQLRLEPRSRAQLREEVEQRHDYDLAYYHYDYPSELYCLWPVLNPAAVDQPGAGNYLGYRNDAELESALRSAMGHRYFVQVKEATHEVHQLIYEKMPFIPLWQLDTHIALHDRVVPVHLDPLLVFTDVERWRLERK